MMNIAALHDAIDAVCPIYGVSVGKFNDKATWTFQPKPEASVSQLEAAQSIIDAWPMEGQ